MTPSIAPLSNLLDDVRRRLRRETTLAVVLGALCAIPGALLTAWLIGLFRPWSGSGFGPLLLDGLAVGTAALLVFFGTRRWIHAVNERSIAADAERNAGMADGAVRGALELSRSVPDGTSAALARRAEADINRRFTGVAPDAVAPGLRGRALQRRRLAAVLFLALSMMTGVLAFAAPDHTRAAWSPMVRPVSYLIPPPLPALIVTPGHAEVRRGGDLDIRVTAPGREAVTLHWQMQGDVPRHEVGPVVGDSAQITIPAVEAATEYWVQAPDGAVSERYRITPTDPLLLADLAIEVIYPPHVGRASEHFQGEAPPLQLPEGTQLVIRGRATRQLAQAALAAGEMRFDFELSADQFTGTFTPTASGVFEWQLNDAIGGDIAVQPAPLDITIVPDAVPSVEITFPATDTVLDATLRQAVVAEARDDYGLVEATLVSWRVSRTGERDTEVEQPLDLNGDDRALIRTLLDASARDLVPGDVLQFHVRVTDSSPRRQTSTSRTVSLRLPGMIELREESADRADQLIDKAEQLATAAEEIQRDAQELERQTSAANARRQADRQRGGRNGGNASQRMDFEESAASRQLLERQEELIAQMEAMREHLEAFEKSMERAGLRDAELRERLEEMRKLYDEMLTPELRRQMEQLREALAELDPEQIQAALEQMAQQQEQMKEQLDESLELMRRAAAEQQMNNLAQEARELATQQQALAESMSEQQPSPEQAATQQELAERAEELEKSLQEMEERLRNQGEQQTAESTKQAQQNTANAGEQMQQAAQDASRRDGQQAGEKGSKAAEELERAAETLDQAREAMAEEWKQDAQQSMEQATRDALELAERQQQLTERMKQAAQQGEQQPQPGQQGEPQQGQQQSGQQQSGQQQSGQQQSGQQQSGKQQSGQQQSGQQQTGKQQSGQQSGQQQSGKQQSGQQQGQRGERQGQEGQQGSQGQQGQQGGQPGANSGEMQSMQAEQAAVQQGLQQLGRNLQESRERSDAVNQEVGSALGRANLSMEQTLEQLKSGEMPADQAQQTVDALNRLALALLNNAQSMNQEGEGGEGAEALQQLADIAKQQGDLNGRSNALSPMNITQSAMNQQMNRMAAEQMEIARRLGDLNRGGQESITGDIDALAREAEQIARDLQDGGMPPETRARQERLFHRLLDAGRSLEKDEYENERTAERPGSVEARAVDELDPLLFQDATRFRAPTAAELQALPPAYRRLILDYFERLNRPIQTQREGPSSR